MSSLAFSKGASRVTVTFALSLVLTKLLLVEELSVVEREMG
jgi:hypothetical protein